MELYNFNLIILLLGALISLNEPVTSISLTNGGTIGESPTSDRLTDRKRIRNNNGGYSVTSIGGGGGINDQPFNQQDGSPSSSRTRGKAVQKFDIEPVDKSAIIGKTVILPCRVLNKVGPLQWTRDGFGLGPDRKLEGFSRYTMIGSDEEGDYSLQIQSVSLEDDAIYQCQVGAAEGVDGIRSRNAALTVFVPPEPPKIIQGDYLRTTAGVTVELTCESHAGKPAAELTWLDGEGNKVSTGTVSKHHTLSDGKRANSALTWTFIPSREHHGKTFTCRAENPALQHPQKASIRVEVKYKPEIQLTSDKSSYMEGDNVKLTCKALANPDTNIIFKWYRNGEVVIPDNTMSLLIPKVTRELNGIPVTCEVSNSVGTSKETYLLDIHYGPVFRSPTENVYAAIEGENVKLKCDPSGNPKPEIAWLFNGSSKVLSTNKELVIPNMSEDKSGRYVCRASVQGFPEASSSTHVFIKGPPKIVSPSMQYIDDDEPVKVECSVHSVPFQSKVTWIHNSQVIDIDNDQGIEVIEDKKPSESITRNVLLIHKRSDEYFGEYNCSVWNEYGQDYKIIRLTKQKSFPMLIIVATIIGSIVAVVSVTIIVILCMKRKSNLDGDDYLSDVKKEASNGSSNKTSSLSNSTKTLTNGSTMTSNGTLTKHLQSTHHMLTSSQQQQQQFQNLHLQQLSHQQSQPLSHHHVVDTGSSGADSDLKVEIRTASSLSERGHWDDLNVPPSVDPTITANQIQQVVDNIYNYTAQPLYSPSKDTSNNNGYIPSYVDYNREYLPPPPLTSEESQLQEAHHQFHHHSQQQPSPGSLIQPQYQNHHQIQQQQQLAAAAASIAAQGQPLYSSGALLNNRDSYIDPNYGTLTLDSRYRSSSYLTSSSPNNSTYLRTTTSTTNPSNNNNPGSTNLASKSSQPSPSALSSIYGTSQRYITSPASNQVKQGTLATHV